MHPYGVKLSTVNPRPRDRGFFLWTAFAVSHQSRFYSLPKKPSQPCLVLHWTHWQQFWQQVLWLQQAQAAFSFGGFYVNRELHQALSFFTGYRPETTRVSFQVCTPTNTATRLVKITTPLLLIGGFPHSQSWGFLFQPSVTPNVERAFLVFFWGLWQRQHLRGFE